MRLGADGAGDANIERRRLGGRQAVTHGRQTGELDHGQLKFQPRDAGGLEEAPGDVVERIPRVERTRRQGRARRLGGGDGQ